MKTKAVKLQDSAGQVINVRVPADVYEVLQEVAEKDSRSVAGLVRHILHLTARARREGKRMPWDTLLGLAE